MQDALSRLVWNERTDAVSKFGKRPDAGCANVEPVLRVGIFAIQSKTNDNPMWILSGLGALGVIVGIVVLWSKHLEKY